jgi:hypothetical protein
MDHTLLSYSLPTRVKASQLLRTNQDRSNSPSLNVTQLPTSTSTIPFPTLNHKFNKPSICLLSLSHIILSYRFQSNHGVQGLSLSLLPFLSGSQFLLALTYTILDYTCCEQDEGIGGTRLFTQQRYNQHAPFMHNMIWISICWNFSFDFFLFKTQDF